MPQPTGGPRGGGPLDVLPSMLHAVFIQTANVFGDPRTHHPRAIVNTNAMVRVRIPVAIDRFQYALDCLEVDILRAKATFRRDLELLREAKANAGREAEDKAFTEDGASQEEEEEKELVVN